MARLVGAAEGAEQLAVEVVVFGTGRVLVVDG